MKKLIIILTVVLLATVMIIPAQATMKKLAQTGLQFLKVDMSARASAMGGSYLTIGNDATAMFYNPAGIGKLQSDFDFYFNQTQWIADITYSSFGIAKNFGTIGTFGISGIFCDYGDIQATRVAPTEQGYEILDDLIDVGAFAVGVSYARALTNKFTVGGTVKWVNQNLGESLIPAKIEGQDTTTIEENKVGDLAFDFGTIFYPGWKSFRFGMSIRNFSRELKYEREGFQLPLTFRIGVAMDVLDFMGEDHENSLLVSIDALHPRDYSERLHVGAEYQFMDMIAFRTGYKTNYDIEGLTAGIGFKYSVSGVTVKVDYSYAHFDVFDSVNRFSFGFSF